MARRSSPRRVSGTWSKWFLTASSSSCQQSFLRSKLSAPEAQKRALLKPPISSSTAHASPAIEVGAFVRPCEGEKVTEALQVPYPRTRSIELVAERLRRSKSGKFSLTRILGLGGAIAAGKANSQRAEDRAHASRTKYRSMRKGWMLRIISWV